MNNHWIWAGGFLALSVGGIAWGALSGIASGRAALHAEATEPEAEPGEGRADPDEALRRELRMAIFLGRQGEFDAAEQALLSLAQRHPERASLWLNLGVARVGAGKLDLAEEAFGKALELTPDDWDAVAELANIALERGDLDAALVHARRIPAEQGRMAARLARDIRWQKVADDPRVRALREKHGLKGEPDTSEAMAAELAGRREKARAGAAAQADAATAEAGGAAPAAPPTPETEGAAPAAPPTSEAEGAAAAAAELVVSEVEGTAPDAASAAASDAEEASAAASDAEEAAASNAEAAAASDAEEASAAASDAEAASAAASDAAEAAAGEADADGAPAADDAPDAEGSASSAESVEADPSGGDEGTTGEETKARAEEAEDEPSSAGAEGSEAAPPAARSGPARPGRLGISPERR